MASGSNRVPLNLLCKEFDISGNAGDDFAVAWIAQNLNTTGWTLTCKVWIADDLQNAPVNETPPPIADLTVTNTFSSPDSTLSVTIPAATTLAQKGIVLWMILKRTNSGSMRTLSQGPVRPI